MTPVGALWASIFFLSMILSENRYIPFRFMLYESFERTRSTRTAAMMITPTRVCCQ